MFRNTPGSAGMPLLTPTGPLFSPPLSAFMSCIFHPYVRENTQYCLLPSRGSPS